MRRAARWARRYFGIDVSGTSFPREFLAGTTTFVAMAYIVAVNPAILGDAGMPMPAVLFATVVGSVLSCLLMGLWANKPFALAPGMGMNAYFTYYVVGTLGVPWEVGMGIVFIEGILCVLLAISPARDRIVESIPMPLKNGIAVGIGVFIALIGLKTAGIVEYDGITMRGVGNFIRVDVLLVVLGVLFMALLHRARIQGSVLFGMGLITLAAVLLGITRLPNQIFSLPEGMLDAVLKLDVVSAVSPRYGSIIIALFLVDFFSTVGTFIGVSLNTNMLDAKGKLPRMKEALIADSLATPLGALLGTTSITTYIETAAGVQAGGRTGVTALVVAAWLLPALLLSPIVRIVPSCATAPALIFVGILMMEPIRTIKSYDLSEKVAFVVLVMATALTFAIDQGMLWGFGCYIVLKVISGKRRDISGFLCVTTGLLLSGKVVQLF